MTSAMYLPLLRGLVTLLDLLNKGLLDLPDADSGPYPDHIPVIYHGELVGFISDQIGDEYSYREASQAEALWWSQRPWV